MREITYPKSHAYDIAHRNCDTNLELGWPIVSRKMKSMTRLEMNLPNETRVHLRYDRKDSMRKNMSKDHSYNVYITHPQSKLYRDSVIQYRLMVSIASGD